MRTFANNVLDRAAAFFPTLLGIALILIVTLVLSRQIQRFVQRATGRTNAPPEIIDLLGRTARFAVVALGVLMILDRLDLSRPVLGFIASLGVAGIIVGFALQDIVKQFAAGVLLLMLRPFSIGDRVTIGAFQGQVMEVQLRATVLKTVHGDEVLIPNADVYSTAIVNQSRYELHRHEISLSVPAEADLEQARTAIAQVLSQVEGVAGDPAPTVVATGLNGEVVNLEVRFWLNERGNTADMIKTRAIAVVRQVLAATSPDQ